MQAKFKTTLLVCLLLAASLNNVFAQIAANAGNDTTVCSGSAVILGGNPTATGGTAPYRYAWLPSTGLSSATVANPSTAPSSTTTYSVTVTDANNNTATNIVIVSVSPDPVANAGPTQTLQTCSPTGIVIGGTPTASGGSGGSYTYSWTPTIGLSSANTANPTVSGLSSATTYQVNVTDANGCTSSAIVVVTVNTNAPSVSISSSGPNSWCSGDGSSDNLTANVTGGGGALLYNWSGNFISPANAQIATVNPQNSGTYTYRVTVTDANSCTATATTSITVNATPTASFTPGLTGGCAPLVVNFTDHSSGLITSWSWVFSNGQTSVQQNPTETFDTAGSYLVALTVTDGQCVSAADTQRINVTPPLGLSVSNDTMICNGRSVTLTASGATTYSWTPTVGLNVSNTATVIATPTNTTTYQVTGTTGTCSGTALVIVRVDNVVIGLDATSYIPCGDTIGPVCATVVGGVPGYNYTWGNIGPAGNCQNISQPGTYTLTVTDGIGCTASGSTNVVQATHLIVDSFSLTSISCGGGNDGSLCVYVSGGGPYAYAWANSGTSQCISGLGAGTYWLTVSNMNGCTATASDVVSQPTRSALSFTTVNPACYGVSDGSITANVTGGTAPYLYNWSNGVTLAVVTGLHAGTYRLTVADSHGCTAVDSATITEPTAFILDSIIAHNATCGLNNGSVAAYVSGGAGNYTYTWNPNAAATATISLLSPGVYILTSTDANGCSLSASASVNAVSVVIDSFHIVNPSCHDSTNGSVCVYASGDAGLTYEWNTFSTVGCLSNLTAGTYSVTVSGSHGCSVSAFANLTLPTPLVDSIAVNNTGCQGCSYTSGGTPPYVFLWSNGNVGACTALSEPGIYIHWVTDTHNCTLTDTVSTIQTNPMHLQVFEPDSNSVPDTVSIIIRGGTPPYTVNWNNTSFVSLPDSSGTYVYGAGENSNMQVMDSFGCDVLYRFDVGCTDQCIWPGDANYDGLVDNNDLLPIGVAYDSTGYTRMNATINFIPQYCVPWNDTLPSGVNYKHIDCNGDGTINADDTAAILLNYGHTHPRGGGAQPWKNNAPVLHVTLSPDTLVDGEIANATLSLGDSALPCTNVYALAFTYNFDPLVVDTQSVSITFGNSWLAGPGDHINIGKTFYNSGELQTALTRIDHTNRSGQGVIGTVSMKITTGNINGKNIQYYLMNSFVNNLTVIDNAGNVLPFNAGADSAHLAFTPTNIIPVPGGDTHLQIFPNPATDQLNISSDLSDITEISINDLAGKSMLVQRMRSASATLNIAELSAGVYIINIQKEGQEYRQRFVKISLK